MPLSDCGSVGGLTACRPPAVSGRVRVPRSVGGRVFDESGRVVGSPGGLVCGESGGVRRSPGFVGCAESFSSGVSVSGASGQAGCSGGLVAVESDRAPDGFVSGLSDGGFVAGESGRVFDESGRVGGRTFDESGRADGRVFDESGRAAGPADDPVSGRSDGGFAPGESGRVGCLVSDRSEGGLVAGESGRAAGPAGDLVSGRAPRSAGGFVSGESGRSTGAFVAAESGRVVGLASGELGLVSRSAGAFASGRVGVLLSVRGAG